MAATEIDILRSAKLVVQEHGIGAWLYAAQRYHELTIKEDVQGAKSWRLIAEIIADWDDGIGLTSNH